MNRETQGLLEEYAAAGGAYPVSRFAEILEEALRSAADPALAVTGLRRVLEASLNRAGLCTDLVHHPWMLDLLVRLTGASMWFTDILVRNPGVFGWLTAEGHFRETDAGDRITREAERALRLFSRPERALDSLKRIHRREILRIGALDLLGHTDLAGVTAELSALADAMIRAVWELSRRDTVRRTGAEPATPAAVLALGKLGGGELNYSSDVDLLVVYADEGAVRPDTGGELTHQEYFHHLTERLLAGLGGASGEGHLYRVDMRLRPDGRAGPLARSLGSCLRYYEARGQQWERQMLLKARPVAGDPEFGAEVLRRLTPFIHPRTQFRHPSEDIARIKARIEASLGEEGNVKLAPGGIRDIEFTVQALQLVHGGRTPGVRSGNTLTALDRLAEHGALALRERDDLREAYVFLRSVEHHLQVRQNAQTHTLPEDPASLDAVARRLGTGRADLLARLAAVRARVRSVFDAVMQSPARDQNSVSVLLEDNAPDEALSPLLARIGFGDTRRAARAFGEILEGRQGVPRTERSRKVLRSAAGDLLREAGRMPDPDAVLVSLALLLGAGAEGDALALQMEDPRVRRILLTLCGAGARLPRMLVRQPLVLEDLFLSPGAAPSRLRPRGSSVAAEREACEAAALARFVLGTADPERVFRELAAGADEAVRRALADELQARRRRTSPLVVLGLGKYGTRERTVDADLDLLFLGAAAAGSAREAAERIAGGIVRRLAEFSGDGQGYDVDVRLRPEGKNAPLVAAPDSWRAYLRTRASLWERQALTRARVVAGEPKAAARVMEDIAAFVYRTPLAPGWAQEIVEMRRRTERRSRTQDADHPDLKLGPGGMMDAEFLAQMLLLAGGERSLPFHAAPLADVLMGEPGGGLPAEDRTVVTESYRLFRRLDLQLRLVLEDRSGILPDGLKLDRLAAAAETTAAALMRECRDRMRELRRILLQTADRYVSET